LIAGKGAPPHRLECARRIAEAQIDLRRIRQVRLSTWSHWTFAWTGPTPDSSGAEPDSSALTEQLLRLDRYERRALSRRKTAIREFSQFG
jgi:hypothetical protein